MLYYDLAGGGVVVEFIAELQLFGSDISDITASHFIFCKYLYDTDKEFF